MFSRHLLLALLLVAPTAFAKAPVDHESLWTLPRVGAPALSPDGRFAAVVVQRAGYDEAAQQADLWLLPVEGDAAPRQLTFDAAAESGPGFSADGRYLVFSSKRAGDSAAQIYLLDLERGGEARPLTAVSTGARWPQFSPDGRHLLFISSVFKDSRNDEDNRRIAKERAERRDNVRIYTGFPVRNWDRWLDDRQQRPLVLELATGTVRDLLAGSELVAGPGYGGRFTFTGEELDAVWAPDSRGVVFSATANRHRIAFEAGHNDLYHVSLDGTLRRLTGSGDAATQDSWTYPRFSPDGKTLLALFTPRGDIAYAANRVAALRWPSLEARPTVELPDALSVVSYGVDADSRTLWMSAEHEGSEKLYRGRLGGTGAQLALAPERGVYSNLQVAPRSARSVLIANHDSAIDAPEVVQLDPMRKRDRLLTRFSRDTLAARDLPPVEHFWSEAADGQRIHNMLIRPAGFDPQRRYPLFVLIHGGPHIQWRDSFGLRWNYHLIAGSEFVVLLSNYSGSTGFGEAFARRIHGDPLRGPADDINRAADAAIARYPFIDGNRQCAGGASYGGHLANWLQGTTTRYRCLVSHAGLVNLESQWGSSDMIYHRELGAGGPVWERNPIWIEQNPLLRAAHFRTPTLVSIGERDYRVPLNNTLEYWSLLQRQQVESRLLVFPDENHWILKGENSRTFYRELDGWLRRWLLAPEAGAASTAP